MRNLRLSSLLGLILLVAAAIWLSGMQSLCPDIFLTPQPEPASVKGTVASKKTGKPIPGIEVIDSEGGVDTTNQNGEYFISNIPFGQITITANEEMAKGYDKDSKRISLGRGEVREGIDFALLDIELPKIALTKRLADPIPAGAGTEDDRTVLATITDNEDVGKAVLLYRASEGDRAYDEISMTQVSEGRYKAVIPKDTLTTVGKFYYYIHAEDMSGNASDEPTEESPLSTSVEDKSPPEIIYFPPVIVSPLNTPATIAPTITDNVRVAEVGLFYQVSGESRYKEVRMVKAAEGDTYHGVIPGEAVVEAGVRYYIRATDGVNEAFWPVGGGPNKPETISPDRLKSITVTPIQASVTSGSTFQFKATPIDDNGTPVSISPNWSVAGDIGTINEGGFFTAIKAGAGSVVATLWDVSKSASVTVTPGSLATIAIDPASAALTSGSTQKFSAIGKDRNNNIVSITPTWSVTGGIGTVDSSGVLTAKKAGSGTVIAASESTSGTASVTVTNSPPIIISLTANPSSVSPGATSTVTAVATDPDGDTISYGWSADYGSVSPSGGSSVVYQAPSALPPAGMATVTVTVNDASKSSTASATITVTNPAIGVVADLKVGSPTVNSLSLTWSAASGAASYSIYRSTSATGIYALAGSGITATSYTDTGLSPNTYYYYKASGVNASGEGFQSSPVSGLTVPGQAFILGVGNPTRSSLTVNWNTMIGNGSVSYKVFRSTSAATGFPLSASDIISTNYTDSGLSCGTTSVGVTYYYKVSAVNSSGEGLQSDYSFGTTLPCLPGQIASLTISSPSTNSLTLTWGAVGGATSYNVYRGLSDSGTFNQVATGLTTTSYTDTGLSPNTYYYYKVSSVSASGEGPQSGSVSGLTIPGQVSMPVVGSPTSSSLAISWATVSGNGSLSYRVHRSISSGGPYSPVASSIVSTSHIDSGLSCGTTSVGETYYYRASAVNPSGEGSQSATSSGTTLPCLPDPPSLTVGNPAVNSLTLTWDAVARATSYNVYRSTSATGTYNRHYPK